MTVSTIKRTPNLIIISSNGQVRRMRLDALNQSNISIGRSQNNDIIIPEDFVGREHAQILSFGGNYYYRDLNSVNGSYIISSSSRNYLDHTSEYVCLSDNSIIRLGSTKNPDRMVSLWFTLMSPQEEIKCVQLNRDKITIGRKSDNDIVLNHPSISREHAYIIRTSTGIELVDNKSSSGVLLNGRKLKECAPLKNKDCIQILGYQLVFSGEFVFYREIISGIGIQVSNVTKTVKSGKGTKKILSDVNLEIKGNEFVAIIGGSGAGKSTLMNTLNGFDRKYSGDVFYNNISITENFQSIKGIIGYVPQEDIIYENLTLREMLQYTAKLRMPGDSTDWEINARIEEVLKTIDLVEHQNTYIRKLSGGQKKRASIAVELLADPKVFFMDEPTSGLDPGTEKNLMTAMNKLSKEQERTIIMVTHTTQSLHLCDKVVFMGPGGNVCFVGDVNSAREYFGTEDLTEIYNIIAAEPKKWSKKYRELQKDDNRISGGSEPADVLSKRNKVSFIKQFLVVTSRYIKLTLNDWRKVAIQIVTPVIMGLIIWFIGDEKFLTGYSGTKSILFTISCAAIWIGLFSGIQEVCKERNIVKREYMANLRLPVYISSKVSVLGVQAALQAVLLSVISLGLLSIKYTGDDDIELIAESTLFGDDCGIMLEVLITVWFTIMASMCMGLLISSLFKNGDKATTVAPFVLIVQLVFSGMLFELDGFKETISYVTFSRWSVDALGRIANMRLLEGYIEGMDENMFEWNASGLMLDWFWLAIMGVLCLIASGFVLRNISKDGR